MCYMYNYEVVLYFGVGVKILYGLVFQLSFVLVIRQEIDIVLVYYKYVFFKKKIGFLGLLVYFSFSLNYGIL